MSRHRIWSVPAVLAGAMLSLTGHAAEKALVQHTIPAADLARMKTRVICSCLFVQQMSPAQCLDGKDEIYRYLSAGAEPVPKIPHERLEVSVEPASAAVRLFDHGKLISESRYLDDGAGCVTGGAGEKFPAFAPAKPERVPEPLPRAELPAGVNKSAIDDALSKGFADRGELPGYTRAVLVVHEGKVVVERYAQTFGPRHRYYLGSVAKVFNNLLAAALVRDGKISVDDPIDMPGWRTADDPRRKITFDQMLHMASGLQWDEEFFKPGAPGYEVFFAGSSSVDVAGFAASLPLEAPPGTHYEYSTGGSNLLGHALQTRIGGDRSVDRARDLAYLRSRVLDPIGAVGVVPEFDAAGTMLTGESIYARVEDMARIGLLFLQNGRWDGQQIFPEGWVEYSTAPTRAVSKTEPYGAQLELEYVVPGCYGHTGVGAQKLIICPERELAVMWLGSDFDFYSWGDYGTLAVAYGKLMQVQAQLINAFPVAKRRFEDHPAGASHE